jgi:trehalose 6-phosphate synthase
MKITLRLILSLLLVATLVASIFSYLQVRSERKNLTNELERRSLILAESFQETMKEMWSTQSPAKLKRFVKRFGNRERLVGIIVYDVQGGILASSPGLPSSIQHPLPQVTESITKNQGLSSLVSVDGKKTHLYTVPLHHEDKIVGALVLFHDASYIDARLEGIWRYNFIRLLTLSLLIAITTVLIVRWSITGPIARFADWLKGLRMGKIHQPVNLLRGDILSPLAIEITHLAKSLAVARAAAEEEARLRMSAESLWTAERLKEFIRLELGGKNLYVVSNREPYMHVKQGREIECIIPAGGLVTALDPVLRICGGVWIAHGSGDADMESSDNKGKLRVPPEEPSYTLKRVWLTKEEEEGYYYGFSNEGIWPLCHITHTRPTFRLEDWIYYQKVNEKFAEALFDEISKEESPLILIQDYHFSLLPLLVKSKRPDARIAIFWHIPWPNPEAFGICPWKKEILLGLLGADLVGFHTQFHCNNFLETIDRFLESKLNWEEFSVERRGHTTLVKPFPISVAFPSPPQSEGQNMQLLKPQKEDVLKEISVQAKYLGVGVDRIDYTKGIIERFNAVERFLEKYTDFIGQFTFVELGAPSRTHIKRYHDLIAEVEETADKINWRFQTKEWKPIVFLKAHHNHETIHRFYRAADVCMVTSLHDGMNLVAKEFVVSRDDEDGVLILSQFTGASRELHDAFIVNPYDIEEMAEAIHLALLMKPHERTERMRQLRQVIKERNIYRWAANLITALVRLRIPNSV